VFCVSLCQSPWPKAGPGLIMCTPQTARSPLPSSIGPAGYALTAPFKINIKHLQTALNCHRIREHPEQRAVEADGLGYHIGGGHACKNPKFAPSCRS